jgi:hypothetical protein
MQRPFKKQRLIGPLFASVSNDDIASKDPEELFQKMRLRSHSYRNYEPEEFFYLAESDEIDNQELLDEMKIIEGGRLVPMLDEVYAFFIPLDLDERRTFNERNPDLMAWVEAYIQLQPATMPPSNTVDIRGLDQ